MSVVSDTYGAVFAEGSVVNLARLETADGELVEPSSMASASYSIVARDLCSGIGDTPVAGHLDQALVPSAVLFDTLQNGDIWDQDETGYNFRHEIDVTTDPAFPVAGKTYLVRYRLTPVSGQPVIFQFSIRAV